jgi:tRNA (guanine-N7-)-methyltransferase
MAKKQLKEYPNIALRPEDIDGRIDFFNIFGRKNEVHPVRDKAGILDGRRKRPVSNGVHIEIGSGKGTFLVNQAAALPDINFLGIEWANKYYKYAVDRMGRKKVGNVRLIRTEAASFVAEHIDDNSVKCFHIYFPDPWPKKRHHKRRFVCAKNIEQIIRCLKKGGLINIATDHAEYFEQMQKVFESFSEKLKPVEFIKPAGANENELVGTNYERKYIKEKRNIFTLAFKKI